MGHRKRIICQECGKRLKAITDTHLESCKGSCATILEYKEKHCGFPLVVKKNKKRRKKELTKVNEKLCFDRIKLLKDEKKRFEKFSEKYFGKKLDGRKARWIERDLWLKMIMGKTEMLEREIEDITSDGKKRLERILVIQTILKDELKLKNKLSKSILATIFYDIGFDGDSLLQTINNCKDKKNGKWCKYNKEYNRKAKLDVIENYGGTCRICGETGIDSLLMHHENGNGRKHRQLVGSTNIYFWLRKNNYPKRYVDEDGTEYSFGLRCKKCHYEKVSFNHTVSLKV